MDNPRRTHRIIYAEVCTYKRKYPEHPYFKYDTEGLIELVKNNDALAAAVLSERFVVDYHEALAFALHSTFASTKPDQLLKIANTQYRTHGVPQKIKNENVIPRYVLFVHRAENGPSRCRLGVRRILVYRRALEFGTARQLTFVEGRH